MRKLTPRRVCFSTSHLGQPKRVNKAGIIGSFSSPLLQTVQKIFEADTSLRLFTKFGKYFRSIKSEDEFRRIEQWVKKQGSRVFIRDCLDLSVALAMTFQDQTNERRTDVGGFVYLAKYKNDKDAR